MARMQVAGVQAVTRYGFFMVVVCPALCLVNVVVVYLVVISPPGAGTFEWAMFGVCSALAAAVLVLAVMACVDDRRGPR
jgi:hypothetical protein